jgi:hypothetical protein
MYHARKSSHWYCGMNAHIGADSNEDIVHLVWSTTAVLIRRAHALGPSRRREEGPPPTGEDLPAGTWV